jgi:hypothetical protein
MEQLFLTLSALVAFIMVGLTDHRWLSAALLALSFVLAVAAFR